MHLRGVLVLLTGAVFCACTSVSRGQVTDEPDLGKAGVPGVVASPGPWDEMSPTNASLPRNVSSSSGGLLQGFLFLGASVMCFGTTNVPLRSLDVGDGIFFQLVFCGTMALEGLLVYLIRGCPEIWTLSLLSGLLYSMGNFLTVPILKTIGLGLGSLIWSVSSLLIAWATARFGWFGIDPQGVPKPTLNYIGTAVTAMSALVLFFLKTDETAFKMQRVEDGERKPLLETASDTSPASWSDRISPPNKRMVGSALAVTSGICYGCSYTPIIYIKNSSLKNATHYRGASQLDLDYFFPYMLGINALTTTVFLGYCFVMKNRPHLPAQCVVPAFVGASLQFVAYYTFFEACYYLGTIITYPIGSTGPALISFLWSVFYFKEIKGVKNFLILGAVIVTVVCGVSLITLSKIEC